MAYEGGNAPDNMPRHGLGKVVSKVDEFLFEPRGKNSIRPVGIPPPSKEAALQQLRNRLDSHTKRLTDHIESSGPKDNGPRRGLGKVLVGLDRVDEVVGKVQDRFPVFDGRPQTLLREQYGPTIKRNLRLIDDIDQGREQGVVDYLSGTIREALKGKLPNERRTGEHEWSNRVQEDINFLRVISPRDANILQKGLDRVTGNS